MPVEKRKAAVIVIVAILAIIVICFFVNYMTGRGLEISPAGSTRYLANFPLVVLPAIGAFLVLIASGNYAGERLRRPRGRPDPKGYATSTWVTSAKVALLIMSAFISLLFLPYVIWSSWFWSFLGGVAGSKSPSLLGLYTSSASIWQLKPLWKYTLSLNVSALFAATTAIIYAKRSSGIRKVK
jgi:hypothetical protein